LSSYAASRLLSPVCPVFSKNHLIYGPGSPPSALKHNEVSSTMTGPPTSLAASTHFCAEISSGSPCSSGRSIFCEMISTGNEPPVLRIALTSSSFLALPVTKVTFGRPAVAIAMATSLLAVAVVLRRRTVLAECRRARAVEKHGGGAHR
jgi:hypothetical protein